MGGDSSKVKQDEAERSARKETELAKLKVKQIEAEWSARLETELAKFKQVEAEWSARKETELAKVKQVEVEWSNKKAIELAKIKFEEMKVELGHKVDMEKLTNEKIKNTLHVQTQLEIISKIKELGYDPDDFCLAAGLSYLTLKDELTNQEMETLKNALIEVIKKKNKKESKGRARHPSDSDTGCETDPENGNNLSAAPPM